MEPVVARIKKGGKNFEILVNPKESLEYKRGRKDLSDVLVSEEIFSDLEQGEKASVEDMKKLFGTEEKSKIAQKILLDGEIQIPKELRDEMIEKKKRQIAAIISRNAINPLTKAPHPLERILDIMEKKGINVSYTREAEDQVNEVIDKIKVELPISIQTLNMEIRIPATYSRMAYGKIKSLGKIVKENWNNDGSLSCIIEIPGGRKNEVYDALGSMTHGEAIIKET